MPIKQYECGYCGHQREIFFRTFAEAEETEKKGIGCTGEYDPGWSGGEKVVCTEFMEPKISKSSFILKGSGWTNKL